MVFVHFDKGEEAGFWKSPCCHLKVTLVIPPFPSLPLWSISSVYLNTPADAFQEIRFPLIPRAMPLPQVLSAVAQRARLLLGNLLSIAGVFDAQISHAKLQH